MRRGRPPFVRTIGKPEAKPGREKVKVPKVGMTLTTWWGKGEVVKVHDTEGLKVTVRCRTEKEEIRRHPEAWWDAHVPPAPPHRRP